MHNIRMKEKLESGRAIDLSACNLTEDGDYILEEFDEGVDYCDAKTEEWIWSIGRDRKTGQFLASTTSKFYHHPTYQCLWLR